MILCYGLFTTIRGKIVEPQAEAQYNALCEKIDKLDIPDETNYKEVEKELLKIVWVDISGDNSDYKDNFLEKKINIAGQLHDIYNNEEEHPTWSEAVWCPSQIEH